MKTNIQKALLCPLFLCFTYLFSYISPQSQSGAYECTCVYYYQCRVGNRTVITNGEGLFTIRTAGEGSCTDTDCNPACIEDYRCCRHELESKPRGVEVTSSPPVTSPSTDSKKGCGFRNPDGVIFRIDAVTETANFGEFPWMVGILEDSGSYRCGGSLIHPSVVLTAAHCVIRKKNYIVRAGEWDSSGTKELLKHKDIQVSSKTIHENFSPARYYYDIALLFLSTPFDLGQHIQTICLPQPNTVPGTDRCYVTGWGKDRFGSVGKYPTILKRIDLPLVGKNTCESNLKQTKLGQYFNLHRTNLCAGGEKDKDACIGDGGGPLVCPIPGEDERYQQIGIVSYGVECNKENVPGVYTNVPFLRDWIDEKMKEKNFDISQFQY